VERFEHAAAKAHKVFLKHEGTKAQRLEGTKKNDFKKI
jgi:hypothetical protein